MSEPHKACPSCGSTGRASDFSERGQHCLCGWSSDGEPCSWADAFEGVQALEDMHDHAHMHDHALLVRACVEFIQTDMAALSLDDATDVQICAALMAKFIQDREDAQYIWERDGE